MTTHFLDQMYDEAYASITKTYPNFFDKPSRLLIKYLKDNPGQTQETLWSGSHEYYNGHNIISLTHLPVLIRHLVNTHKIEYRRRKDGMDLLYVKDNPKTESSVSRILAGESVRKLLVSESELEFNDMKMSDYMGYSGVTDFPSGEKAQIAYTDLLTVILDGAGIQIDASLENDPDAEAFSMFNNREFKNKKEALDFFKSLGLDSTSARDDVKLEKLGFQLSSSI